MKDQGASMPAAERKIIAEHLSGRAIGAGSRGKSRIVRGSRKRRSRSPVRVGPDGARIWRTHVSNRPPRPALTADQVPRLKLKWVFGYPNTFSSNGAPTLAGGRIFVPSANRNIYSLDAKTGCVYWSIETQAPVRTAITVASVAIGERTRQVAFFGDQRGFAYGVDAASGELLWKVRIDEHARSKIVGAPVYHDARVYVPITAGEEGSAMSPAYECCSGRGGLVALEAATGKQIWRTYTIEETPRPTKKSATGGQLWGPSWRKHLVGGHDRRRTQDHLRRHRRQFL
jgi:polyvinyl alcohol dehydrogenase (cytochrome)